MWPSSVAPADQKGIGAAPRPGAKGNRGVRMLGCHRIPKWLGSAAAILLGMAALSIPGAVLFFHWMSLGELRAWPRGGSVTVAFSESPAVRAVMRDICGGRTPLERRPSDSIADYERFLSAAAIVRVPDGASIVLIERGSTLNGTLSSFTFRKGPWKGKEGWACPSEVILLHAYP